MKISLITIGKKMPDWIQTGIEHYQKQLPREMNFNLLTPKRQKRKNTNIKQIKESEGELLLKGRQGFPHFPHIRKARLSSPRRKNAIRINQF